MTDKGDCWFCGKGISRVGSLYDVVLQKVIGREFKWWESATTIRYQRCVIKIFRCPACKLKHFQSKLWEFIPLALGALIGICVGLQPFAGKMASSSYWVAGGLSGLLMGWVFGAICGEVYLKICNVKSLRKFSIKKNLKVKEALQDGWIWGDLPIR